jgi:hypothetical protein
MRLRALCAWPLLLLTAAQAVCARDNVILVVRDAGRRGVCLHVQVALRPEDADLTPTQLLQKFERDEKWARRCGTYPSGAILRWDAATAKHDRMFAGLLDGPDCTIRVRDLRHNDIIVFSSDPQSIYAH